MYHSICHNIFYGLVATKIGSAKPVSSCTTRSPSGDCHPSLRFPLPSRAFHRSSTSSLELLRRAEVINGVDVAQPFLDFLRMNSVQVQPSTLGPFHELRASIPSDLIQHKAESTQYCQYPLKETIKENFCVLRKPPASKKHLDLLPTKKLQENLKMLSKDKPAVVLVLGGSFNPVHRMHLNLFERAKKYLKNTNGEDRVVGGFIAPSGDSYVKHKLGSEAMKFRHRANACRLAVENSNWIDICDWGLVSVSHICRNIQDLLRKEFPDRNFKMVEVCGADYALKYKLNDNEFDVLCFGRPGATQKLKMGVKGHPCNIALIDDEPDEISSTEVRKKIQNGEAEQLKVQNCLPMDVLQYVVTTGDTLFY